MVTKDGVEKQAYWSPPPPNLKREDKHMPSSPSTALPDALDK
jgi:hypothetical protein